MRTCDTRSAVTSVTEGPEPTRTTGARSGNALAIVTGVGLPHVLIPYDKCEAITTAVAARIAGPAERTIRLWCEQHHIGRRVGGGPWMVSRVALSMFLDGDDAALAAYLDGDRTSARVVAYYQRAGLGRLLREWSGEISATAAIPAAAT